MLKEIRKCSVNQLLTYRTNHFQRPATADSELPLAICIFLECPRLLKMTVVERNALFKEFVKSLTPDIQRRMIDV